MELIINFYVFLPTIRYIAITRTVKLRELAVELRLADAPLLELLH
jgi:hypothetical protein